MSAPRNDVEDRIGAVPLAVDPVVVPDEVVGLATLSPAQRAQPVEQVPLGNRIERAVTERVGGLTVEPHAHPESQIGERLVGVHQVHAHRQGVGRVEDMILGREHNARSRLDGVGDG